jgi:hypothetical protein
MLSERTTRGLAKPAELRPEIEAIARKFPP